MNKVEFRQVEDTKDIKILKYTRTGHGEYDVSFGDKDIGFIYTPVSSQGMVVLVITDKDTLENKTGGRDTYTFETTYNLKRLLSNMFYSS